MWRIQIAVLLATLLPLDQIQSFEPPSGKCDTRNIVRIHPPLEGLDVPRLWKVVYSTESSSLKNEIFSITPVGETNFTVVNIKTWKDRLPQVYACDIQITNDTLYEYPRGYTDPARRYMKFMLGITPSLALYFYRCSETGIPGVYQRLIAAPVAVTPSAEEIQTLLDMDRATFGYNKGVLGRLSNIN